MSFPFVTVIIVNYNGAHYLPICLAALHDSSYPSDCYEVIVSDNGSTDSSLELLRTKYPWVRVLENKRNLGFASGNNAAIHVARGDYFALINNDTLAAPRWLDELVAVAESNPRAGLVTGRLQLYHDQLILEIGVETAGAKDAEVAVQVFGVNSGAPRAVVQYLDGFYGWEISSSGHLFRRTHGNARIGVPVPHGNGDWTLRMQLAPSRPDHLPVCVRVSALDGVKADWVISTSEPSEYEMQMPAALRSLARPLVQNTGAIIFRTGAARDRGSFVRGTEVFYETDDGQYGQVEQVFSGCGANLMIRRAILDKVGAFDDDFFMYYEDTDLAWRARLQGWQVLYAPDAVVRHIHSGTSEEWSPFFLYLVERNRLAMVFKNGSRRQVISTWGRFFASITRNTAIVIRSLLRRQAIAESFANRVRSQHQALGTLLAWLPGLIVKRFKIQHARTIPFADIEKWFVD